MNATHWNTGFARRAGHAVFATALLALAACAMHPVGEKEERDRAEQELRALDEPIAAVPLPEDPTLADYLRTAFHADAGLRAAYWQWRAALERIPQEASPPNAAISFSYLFSNDHMTAWDRTTLGLQNEPMSMLPAPTKLSTAGRRALDEARAAGLRFESAKFALQDEVTALFLDLALHRAQMRAQEETQTLLHARAVDADARLASGRGTQDDALRTRDDLERAESQLHSLHAQIPLLFAHMNRLLGRSAELPLPLPEALPEPSPLTLPFRTEAIRGAIAEAQANLAAAQAAQLRYARDLAASFVVNLAVLRDSERQIDLFERVFLPRATAGARTAEAGLATGRATFADVVGARRTEIDTAFLLAQLKAEREKTLAAIDAWQGVDVAALHGVRMGAMSAR